jgi:hypothetical protein
MVGTRQNKEHLNKGAFYQMQKLGREVTNKGENERNK